LYEQVAEEDADKEEEDAIDDHDAERYKDLIFSDSQNNKLRIRVILYFVFWLHYVFKL